MSSSKKMSRRLPGLESVKQYGSETSAPNSPEKTARANLPVLEGNQSPDLFDGSLNDNGDEFPTSGWREDYMHPSEESPVREPVDSITLRLGFSYNSDSEVEADGDDNSVTILSETVREDSEVDAHNFSFTTDDGSDGEEVMERLREMLCYSPEVYAHITCINKGDRLKIGLKDAAHFLLLTKKDRGAIASQAPFKPKDDCVFLIDMSAMSSYKDVCSDGYGRWIQNSGAKKLYVLFEDGWIKEIGEAEYREGQNTYLFERRYYTNKDFPMQRNIVHSADGRCPFLLLQYKLNCPAEECDFTVSSHGNRKHGSEPYYRTSETIKRKIKSSSRDEALSDYESTLNNLDAVDHPATIPRNKRQILNLTRGCGGGEHIEDVMVKCREEAGSPDVRFIREATVSPCLFIFLATERQLKDMEKHCCNSSQFSVLGIDTTFNCGKFYVTVFTYRHLLMRSKYNRVSSINPVMVGAIFVHHNKSADAYTHMVLSLIAACPSLRNQLRVFGTDADEALYGPCRDFFTGAQHLLCSLHMRDNIERKLVSLGVSKTVRDSIAQDIDGKRVGNGSAKTAGLVDCSAEDFYDAAEKLYADWETSIGENGLQFVDYFRKEKADQFHNCLLLEKRFKAKLGFDNYTQNANECINSVIKCHIEAKLSCSEFVEEMRMFVAKQERQIEHALIGKSESMELLPEYSHLECHDAYFDSRPSKGTDRKLKLLKKVHTEPLVLNSVDDFVMEDDNGMAASAIIDGPSTSSGIVTSRHSSQTNKRGHDDTAQCNSVAKISKVTYIPKYGSAGFPLMTHITDTQVRLVMSKADLYAADSSYLKDNLGNDPYRFAACSERDKTVIHQVVLNPSTGQITCSGCLGYETFKFCAHALAVAFRCQALPKYVEWHNKKAGKANLDAICGHKVAKGVGKKATSSTQIRRGTSKQTQPVGEILSGPGVVLRLRKVKEGVVVSPQPYQQELHFLSDCHDLVSSCYSCHKKFKRDEAPPNDLVIVSNQYRSFRDQHSQKEQHGKISNVYLHFNMKCLEDKITDFSAETVIIKPEVKEKLLLVHKLHIKTVLKVAV